MRGRLVLAFAIEFEAHTLDLAGEIERVRLELDRKRKHEAAAHSLFKS